jgi:hypothetical protein
MGTFTRPVVASHEDPFLQWLDSEFIRVAAHRKHDQWYAIAEDFDIVGMGPTEAAAHREVAGLVEAYLRSFHRDGLRYRDAWRPVPLRLRLRNMLVGLIARGLQPTPVRIPFGEESRTLLPGALRNGHG